MNLPLDTERYAHYIQAAQDWVIAATPGVVSALFILIVGRILVSWLANMVRKALVRVNIDETLVRFLHKLVYYVLLIALLIAAADQIGIKTTSFMAILGAAGLAVGLALKDSLSNFASGVMIILFRPFKVGDFVTAGGQTGTVKQIDIFSTIITTGDNQQIIIPNATITQQPITNVTAEKSRRIDLTEKIKLTFDELGISFPFPQQDVHMHSATAVQE